MLNYIFFVSSKPLGLSHQRAFTVIELLVAIAIMGLISVVAVPSYHEYIERGETMQTIADMQDIDAQMAIYTLANNGSLPDSLADIGMGDILDPWGNTYQYLNLSNFDEKGKAPKAKGAKGAKGGGPKAQPRKDHNLHPINSDYDLYSMGKDGKSVSPLTGGPSRDDIIRANNGRFVGKVSNYL